VAEAVEGAGSVSEAPRRRGRPKGARDAKPRKRRNDGINGQVLDAGAVTTAAAIAPRPAPAPAAVQLPLAPPSPAPPEGESQPQLDGSLEDLRRKLKAEADIKEGQAERVARENAVANGLLIPRAGVDDMLARRAAVLKRSLLTLPDRISAELALESDPRRIRVRLLSELEGLLRSYSGQSAQARPASPAEPIVEEAEA